VMGHPRPSLQTPSRNHSTPTGFLLICMAAVWSPLSQSLMVTFSCPLLAYLSRPKSSITWQQMFLKSPVAFAQGETWDSATLQTPAPNAFQEKVTCAYLKHAHHYNSIKLMWFDVPLQELQECMKGCLKGFLYISRLCAQSAMEHF